MATGVVDADQVLVSCLIARRMHQVIDHFSQRFATLFRVNVFGPPFSDGSAIQICRTISSRHTKWLTLPSRNWSNHKIDDANVCSTNLEKDWKRFFLFWKNSGNDFSKKPPNLEKIGGRTGTRTQNPLIKRFRLIVLFQRPIQEISSFWAQYFQKVRFLT